MTEAQYRAVENLKCVQYRIKRELEIWEKELTNKSKLGYLEGGNDNFCPFKLKTSIPSEIFDAFRTASMNALNLRLVEIDKEIAEI